MNDLLTEFRVALRHPVRSPSFSILVIVTLALGIALTLAAVVASFILAYRASRIEPSVVLRSE